MIYDTVAAVKIHLAGKHRIAAKIANRSLKYTGPNFVESPGVEISVAIGIGTINVRVTPENIEVPEVEYCYPLHTVGRIRITS